LVFHALFCIMYITYACIVYYWRVYWRMFLTRVLTPVLTCIDAGTCSKMIVGVDLIRFFILFFKSWFRVTIFVSGKVCHCFFRGWYIWRRRQVFAASVIILHPFWTPRAPAGFWWQKYDLSNIGRLVTRVVSHRRGRRDDILTSYVFLRPWSILTMMAIIIFIAIILW